MNVKLLRKVKKHILEEPKRLVMWGWVKRKGVDKLNDSLGNIRPFPKCGTAGCIAGWASILSGHANVKGIECFRIAQHALELTNKQADKLFGPICWPTKFDAGTSDTGTPKAAKVAAARIEHFIKTKGAE